MSEQTTDVVRACDETWEFDTDFYVTCSNVDRQHLGNHAALIEGNGGVPARVTWPCNTPTTTCVDPLAGCPDRSSCSLHEPRNPPGSPASEATE